MEDESNIKQEVSDEEFERSVLELVCKLDWGKLQSALQENFMYYKQDKKSFSAKQVRAFFELINKQKVKFVFEYLVLDYLFDIIPEGSLDANCVKEILKRNNNKFDSGFFPKFLNVCGENSLDDKNLKDLCHVCNESVFEDANKNEIESKLNETSKKLFQNLCEFHERKVLAKELPEREEKNKKLGILGIAGIIFGGLFGSAAIGLGVAIGVGALAVTIFAPIVAAVVSLVLIGIFSYLIDKFRVNKELNKIVEAKLNEKVVDKKEIPFDLRNRKEIQNALDELKAPLLQNIEDEITQ